MPHEIIFSLHKATQMYKTLEAAKKAEVTLMTKSHSENVQKTNTNAVKQKRLSAALRANLIRRKTQVKSREELKKENETSTK